MRVLQLSEVYALPYRKVKTLASRLTAAQTKKQTHAEIFGESFISKGKLNFVSLWVMSLVCSPKTLPILQGIWTRRGFMPLF